MKSIRLILSAGFAIAFLGTQTSAQSLQDIESRYQSSFRAYEIRPGVMMIAETTTNGQISEIRINSFAGRGEAIHLGNPLSAYLVKEIIDELVPVEQRGTQGEYFGLTLLLGSSWTAGYEYENVSITLMGSIIRCPDSSADTTLPASRARRNNPFQSAEVILIKWKNVKSN
jgi:hypothetical protein